uniref:Uncharacterized protein n=1 Tax=Arundo donax TaxID=35708 RepID=A0A0A9D0U6_ARUDO
MFSMNKGVLGSLRIWGGEVEPVSELTEVWVQVRGVPLKWCDWVTLRQIGSTLGKVINVDWNSLFSSYFEMVRIKVACKDLSKIPLERLMQMEMNLYLINLLVEGWKQYENFDDLDDNGDDDSGDDNKGNKEKKEQMDTNFSQFGQKENKGSDGPRAQGLPREEAQVVLSLWLFGQVCSVIIKRTLPWAIISEIQGVNLLNGMELAESDSEEFGEEEEVEVQ